MTNTPEGLEHLIELLKASAQAQAKDDGYPVEGRAAWLAAEALSTLQSQLVQAQEERDNEAVANAQLSEALNLASNQAAISEDRARAAEAQNQRLTTALEMISRTTTDVEAAEFARGVLAPRAE